MRYYRKIKCNKCGKVYNSPVSTPEAGRETIYLVCYKCYSEERERQKEMLKYIQIVCDECGRVLRYQAVQKDAEIEKAKVLCFDCWDKMIKNIKNTK